jgi:hypothetical protein
LHYGDIDVLQTFLVLEPQFPIDSTGHYMASSSSSIASMMSPRYSHPGGKSCVQFEYFTHQGGSNTTLSVQLLEESEKGTVRDMWMKTVATDGYWLNGQFDFDLPTGDFRVAFMAKAGDGSIVAVDNVAVISGSCPKLGRLSYIFFSPETGIFFKK